MPDSVSNSDIDAILRRQISSVAAQEKCDRNDPNEISAYLEGALSSKRVADFEQHLVNCAVCRQTVVELRALDNEGESPVAENVKADAKNDESSSKIPASGFVERLRKLLFGSGGAGYMWRPAAALVMILMIVAAPAVLFLRQSREDGHLTSKPVGANREAEHKPSADSAPGGVTFSVSPGDVGYTDAAPGPAPTAGKNAVVQSPEAAAKKDAGEPGGVAGQPAGAVNGPASPPPPPPAPAPAIVAQTEDKVTTPPKALPAKQETNEELDRAQREAGVASMSNSAYGATLTWNVTVTMTPVESREALSDLSMRRDANTVSPDRGIGGGVRGGDAQQPANAKSAPATKPATKKDEDSETRSRADDQKRKEATAKKPADSPAPTVPYDKRVAQILKARFDKLMENKVRSGTGVMIRFRVGVDGSVISLKDGKLPEADIIKRSSNDVINTAVMQAISAGKLPAFGDSEKDYFQIILIIKFDPTVN